MLWSIAVLIAIAVALRTAVVALHRLLRRLQDPSLERWRDSG